jgi:hypothetical protein
MNEYTETQEENIIQKKNLICVDTDDNPVVKNEKRNKIKGKLYLGPVWNAFNRENLGSIPRKIENVLVNDKTSKLGFLSQTDRFCYRDHESNGILPGPASYHSSNMNATGSTFYSSKGFGNGFASTCDRFNERDYDMLKYKPGPGEYKVENKFTVVDSIQSSLNFKSLYGNTQVKSMKITKNTPGPGYYNPILSKANQNVDRALSSFTSKVIRFRKNLFDGKSIGPGPGNYFTEMSSENKLQNMTTSHFFRSPPKKKIDLIKKYIFSPDECFQDIPSNSNLNHNKDINNEYKMTKIGKTEKMKNETKYSKTTKSFKKDNHFNSKNNNYTNEIKYNIFTNKAIFSALKKKKSSEKEKVEDLSKLALMYKKDTKHNEEENTAKEEETDIINKIIDTSKKSIFELSPVRWKNKRVNHNPGPAYYDPVPATVRTSFNKSSSAWI